MKYSLLFLMAFFYAGSINAQNLVTQTSEEICDCLKRADPREMESIDNCVMEGLSAPAIIGLSNEKYDAFYDKLMIHINKNCKRFHEIYQKEENEFTLASGWKLLEEIPESSISPITAKAFFQHNELFYMTSDGAVIQCKIDDTQWIEYLNEGKYYSKCSMEWIKDGEFEIAFEESNHPVKSQLSKKGEIYRYRLIDFKNGVYTCVLMREEMNFQFFIFTEAPIQERL